MADGRDDRVARGPKRGSKLRYSGDENGDYKPDYSDTDYSITGAYLNQRVDMSEQNHGNRISTCGKAQRAKTGCLFREPLS